MKKRSLVLATAFLLTGWMAQGQSITIDQTQTPAQLVNNVLVGTGVVVSNIEFNYSVPFANALQTQCGYFTAGTSSFPISEGFIMGTGDMIMALGPNDETSATNNTGVAADPNDPDLDAISTAVMNNEAVLEFDFIPSGDSVVFNYIFASEEYPEYSPSSFNDAFGFFISGPGISGSFSGGAINIAQLPAPVIPVTINNVNPTTNATYYISNAGGTSTQFDGHTVVLTAAASVQCGETYHIKLAIADAGDQAFESAVFLEANSFSSNGVQVQIASATGSAAITEACDSAIVTFIRPSDQTSTALTIDYNIGGTAINGTDYPFLPGTVTFPIGVDTVQFYVTPSSDGLTEGTETVILGVSIVNECGDTITTEATIEIVDPIPFTVVPVDVTIDCPVPTVTITANPSAGVPAFDYDWQIGGTTPSIDVPGNIVGTTTYDVDITDACGTTATGTVTVTLNPAPVPTITFNNNTVTICPNDDATFIATVVNPYSPTITYDWSPAPGSTNTITVSPNVLTWYYLTINDGCYDVTDSVKVDIGNIDLTDINVTDATNCPGQPGVPGSIEVLPDDPSFTFTLIGGGDTFGPQTSNTFLNLDGGIIYFLHVENLDGCTIDTAISVGLGANAVVATWVPASEQDVTCFGDLNGAAEVSNISGGITPPYDVTWTHTSGLYDQTTVGVGGGDAINNLMGGNWVVTVTDQEGCAWSQLFNIYEPAELTLDFISNNPNCYLFTDGSVTASTSGGNGGNTFTMTNSAGTQLNLGNSNTINQLGEGWYYTTIVDNNGCTVEDSIFVDQPDELDIDLIIDQPLCYGIESGYAEVDTVYNYNGSYGGISYYWSPNPSGTNGVGATFSNHMGPGTYALTINDENGCSKVFDFTITYPDELVFTEIGYHPAHCRIFSYQSGNGVVYAAAAGGTPDYNYLWVNNTTGQTSTNTTWGGLNPGSYTMTVTDDAGCTLVQTVQLDSVSPIADFDIASDEFLTPGVYEGTAIVCVEFTNQSQYFANEYDPNADTTFFWNLNSPTAGWQISHDVTEQFDTCYTSEGVYTVCLVALNKNGCSDTACVDLIIHDPLEFTPVNVFSPDGDGVNDDFTFAFWAQAVATFECTIVNRWGVTVNVMDDINDVWDGTDLNGDPCTDGIYFYTYSGVATNGDTFSGQGFTHIVNSGN
ncbi:MAG: choice-of-anchor L domain-containing protein [Bacteroidetes bacterium]|nr:choice-of-anchor L domain-containing protein [Bacteroidota bacterium]